MADEPEITAAEQPADAYAEYISRKRAGEPRLDSQTATGLDPEGFIYQSALARKVLGTWDGVGATQQIHYPEGTIRVEGPTLSNGVRYVAKVWMVPHRSDGANSGGEWVLLLIPIVGWAILAKRQRNRLAAARDDRLRPWAWTLTREGPAHWPVVTVPWERTQRLGLRHPEPDSGRPGYFVAEQMEDSKEAALLAARSAVAQYGS